MGWQGLKGKKGPLLWGEAIWEAFQETIWVRVIASQKLPRDSGESIFAARHQDGSQGPLGRVANTRVQEDNCFQQVLNVGAQNQSAGKRQESATFLQRSFFNVALQFFARCGAPFGQNDIRTAEKPMLQKSQCCSATSAAQHSENCSATSFFACGMWVGFRGVRFRTYWCFSSPMPRRFRQSVLHGNRLFFTLAGVLYFGHFLPRPSNPPQWTGFVQSRGFGVQNPCFASRGPKTTQNRLIAYKVRGLDGAH